jgi:hypothetical protein
VVTKGKGKTMTTYTNLGNERNVNVAAVRPGQQVYLFGAFRTAKRVERPDYRRTFNVVITDTTGQVWPVDAYKTVTVRDE